MRSSFPQIERIVFAALILGFSCFFTILDAYADLYEETLLKASQGDADAQVIIARMYFMDDDLPQTYIKAYAWCNLAAAKGHKEGEIIFNKLIKLMTPRQIAEGNALSAQFKKSFGSHGEENENINANKEIDNSLEQDVDLSQSNRHASGSLKEIARDERFIAYANGTVLDTRTGLMWAAGDNGEDISWHDAKKYCEDYIGGWHKDWRMPTLDELSGLYNTGRGYKQDCCLDCSKVKITSLIKLSCCCLWSAETDGYGAAHFVFRDAFRGWNYQADYVINRVLPVRDGN